MNEKRYGFIGIVVERGKRDAGAGERIQAILSEYGDIIRGRMGLPHLEEDTLSVITLIVHATTDELGALTGKLGRLSGVSVKSALARLPGQAGTKEGAEFDRGN